MYTHITQLMTHTTNVYITAAYLAIMLQSFLAYSRGELRVKRCVYHLNRAKVDTFFLRKVVANFINLLLHFHV